MQHDAASSAAPTPKEIENIIESGDSEAEDEFEESLGDYDPMQALAQLFVTSEGETLVDVLSSIRDTLEKGTKILYKLQQTMHEKK